MRTSLQLAAALIIATCCSSITFAENLATKATITDSSQWYQVEVIVFSHLSAEAVNSEQWPFLQPTRITPDAAIDLTNIQQTSNDTINYQLLPSTHFKLKREQKKLDINPRYHVLLHLAWLQKFTPNKTTQPIHIFGGDAFSASGSIIPVDKNPEIQYDSQPNWQVDGTLRINLNRFFNINFNLLIAEPISQLARFDTKGYFDGAQQNLAYFRISQSRRMRSGELDYIDHPLYGALIKVFSVKNKKDNLKSSATL